MKLEDIEELSSRRRRGACGLDGEALEPSGVTGLRRRWPGATLREDIGDARLLSSLIVRGTEPAVEEQSLDARRPRSFSFLFLKKKRVLAQPCNVQPCNPLQSQIARTRRSRPSPRRPSTPTTVPRRTRRKPVAYACSEHAFCKRRNFGYFCPNFATLELRIATSDFKKDCSSIHGSAVPFNPKAASQIPSVVLERWMPPCTGSIWPPWVG